MFVLGIDPGVSRCGYACIQAASSGPHAIAIGVLRTSPDDPLPRRLAELQQGLRELFDQYAPDALAIERVLFQNNARTAMSVGQASGLAMAEAYVLAGEIGRAGNDYAAALARYESRMRPFLAGKQASARKFASTFVPNSGFGVVFRDWMMRLMDIPMVANFFVGELTDNIELPDYQAA